MDTIDVDLTVPHPSFVDRYFTRKYQLDVRGTVGEDQCVLVHTNKLFVITIAPSHPILKDKKIVTSVNFQVSENVNRLENRAVGKSKKTASKVSQWSPLCHVTCSDNTIYTLCSCVRGSLLEVNETLVTCPELLARDPEETGYVAIVMSDLKEFQKEAEKLLSQDNYNDITKERSKELENDDSRQTNS